MPSTLLASQKKGEVRRNYLSFSAVSTFASCPLKFFFKYVQGLPDECVAASLIFGSSIHAAVQFHFEQLLAGAASDVDALLSVFHDEWRSRAVVPVQYGKRENFEDYCRMADRTLKAFLASDFARPHGRIIGVEEELRGYVVPGVPEILGRVDLLVDEPNALVITDFKTSRTGWSESHVIESSPQLLLYNELARPLADGRQIRLQFAVMTKTRTPDFTVHQVENDPGQLERMKLVIQRVWQAIQSQHFFPNPTPLNCPSCSYRNACKAWKG